MADHIHCVCQLNPEPSVAKVVQDVKSYSSGWVKRRFRTQDFAWQKGYGPFSVSPSKLQDTIDYVRNQKEHHKTRSFAEEYAGFLRLHGIEFDPVTLFEDAPGADH